MRSPQMMPTDTPGTRAIARLYAIHGSSTLTACSTYRLVLWLGIGSSLAWPAFSPAPAARGAHLRSVEARNRGPREPGRGNPDDTEVARVCRDPRGQYRTRDSPVAVPPVCRGPRDQEGRHPPPRVGRGSRFPRSPC